MTPVVPITECSTPALPGAGAGSVILLGPWMPMELADTSDGFEQCSTAPVAVEECATPAVALDEQSTPHVTFTQGGI